MQAAGPLGDTHAGVMVSDVLPRTREANHALDPGPIGSRTPRSEGLCANPRDPRMAERFAAASMLGAHKF
jgi:hypothetical protein